MLSQRFNHADMYYLQRQKKMNAFSEDARLDNAKCFKMDCDLPKVIV